MATYRRRHMFMVILVLAGFICLGVFVNDRMARILLFQVQKGNRTVRGRELLHTAAISANHSAQPENSKFKVPNIVHYIWYENQSIEFRFDKALSVLSAIKYIKPEAVYFHTNMEPKGAYYDELKNISIFKVVKRDPPKSVIKDIYHETDYSNYDRVKVLAEKGGIYLDLDVMVTQSFDDLRKHPCTLGFQGGTVVCAGVIVCQKDHPFLYIWLNTYHDDYRKQWAYNSGTVSSRIVQRFPNIIHIEKTRLHVPTFGHLEQIWGKEIYKWRNNYAIHTWIRLAKKRNYLPTYPTPESIQKMNSTYGEMARMVYFGTA